MRPVQQVDVQQFKRVFILFNRFSGKQLFATNTARINQVFKLLKENLHAQVEMLDVRYFEQMPELARRVVDEQCEWVIIAGGDGTIRAFVEDLLRLDYHPYISVFPAGTVNLIAKEVGLSREPEVWVRRALRGYVYDFYTARANGNLFLTVASVGFDSLVVDNVGFMEKRLLNKFAYILTGTETIRKEFLFSHWKYEFAVRFDDEEEWHSAASVIVGKSRYYAGRFNLFQDAAITSPNLYVALFPGRSQADLLKYASLITLEGLDLDRSIVRRPAKSVEIRCLTDDGEFPVELDGDAVTTTPLKLKMEAVPLKLIP